MADSGVSTANCWMRWPHRRRRRSDHDSLPARLPFVADLVQGQDAGRRDGPPRPVGPVALPAIAAESARGYRSGHVAGPATTGRIGPPRIVLAARADRDRFVTGRLLRQLAGGTIGLQSG